MIGTLYWSCLKPFENRCKLLMKEGAAKEHTNQVGQRGKSADFEDGYAYQLSPMSYIFLMGMQNSFVYRVMKVQCLPILFASNIFCNKRFCFDNRFSEDRANLFSRQVYIFCLFIFPTCKHVSNCSAHCKYVFILIK